MIHAAAIAMLVGAPLSIKNQTLPPPQRHRFWYSTGVNCHTDTSTTHVIFLLDLAVVIAAVAARTTGD